jgi:hypothetical protein
MEIHKSTLPHFHVGYYVVEESGKWTTVECAERSRRIRCRVGIGGGNRKKASLYPAIPKIKWGWGGGERRRLPPPPPLPPPLPPPPSPLQHSATTTECNECNECNVTHLSRTRALTFFQEFALPFR